MPRRRICRGRSREWGNYCRACTRRTASRCAAPWTTRSSSIAKYGRSSGSSHTMGVIGPTPPWPGLCSMRRTSPLVWSASPRTSLSATKARRGCVGPRSCCAPPPPIRRIRCSCSTRIYGSASSIGRARHAHRRDRRADIAVLLPEPARAAVIAKLRRCCSAASR